MSAAGTESNDPYSSIAILGDRDFELSGDGLTVPLQFRPDAAFVLVTFLAIEGDCTARNIFKTPGFDEAVGGKYPEDRFQPIFSKLRFTFDALNSTLIQARERENSSLPFIYYRNPDYEVIHSP